MSIWYSDPQPVQRAPRLPVAALTTGSQPPRMTVAGAIALACVVASCPAQGEPRLTQQQSNPPQIAAVIPAVVSQAPRVGTSNQTEYALLWSWPVEGEPRPIQPSQGRSVVAPLTLKYGQQPPVTSFVTVPELALVRAAWEPVPPTPPPLLRLTAGGVVVAPPYLPPSALPTVPVGAWTPLWSAPPSPVDLAPLVGVLPVVPSLSSQATQLAGWMPSWQAPPTPVLVVPPVTVLAFVPITVAPVQPPPSWWTPPASASIASLLPGVVTWQPSPSRLAHAAAAQDRVSAAVGIASLIPPPTVSVVVPVVRVVLSPVAIPEQRQASVTIASLVPPASTSGLVLALSPTRVVLASSRTAATLAASRTTATLTNPRTTVTLAASRVVVTIALSRSSVTLAASRTSVTLS